MHNEAFARRNGTHMTKKKKRASLYESVFSVGNTTIRREAEVLGTIRGCLMRAEVLILKRRMHTERYSFNKKRAFEFQIAFYIRHKLV
jgi:hypothetical protein